MFTGGTATPPRCLVKMTRAHSAHAAVFILFESALKVFGMLMMGTAVMWDVAVTGHL